MDTSVWGGYFDTEFAAWTIPFIDQAREGRFTVVLSDITVAELQDAPEQVRLLPTTIPADNLELVNINSEQLTLADRYVNEGALTPKYRSDARHIAITTVLKLDTLVSWNFRHMVNFFRIKQYNSINLKFGYQTIDIRTPKEVTYASDTE